mgnify:CR=1 FL=1
MDHPRKDSYGRLVTLAKPSTPTALSTWTDATALACVVPDGRMPPALNGVRFERCHSAPPHPDSWEALAQAMPLEEPPFQAPAGRHTAAGAVVRAGKAVRRHREALRGERDRFHFGCDERVRLASGLARGHV